MKRALILAAVAVKAAILTVAIGYGTSSSPEEADVALCCHYPSCDENDPDCS